MERQANAKINICLKITGMRPDGYHDLDMIFLELDFGDKITMEKIDSGILLSCGDNSILPEKNLAYRAANVFLKKYRIGSGVRISIDKNIPSMAGLGGGSSDAACVLNMLCDMFDIHPFDRNGSFDEEFIQMAASLGADVPFFLKGGCQRAKGIGDKLTEIKKFPDCSILLLKPAEGVSTPEAYKGYDEMKKNGRTAFNAASVDAAQEAAKTSDLEKVCANMCNDLEPVVIEKVPFIGVLKKELMDNGAVNAMMSGSGSAVFGIFESKEKADRAQSAISSKYDIFSVVTRSAVRR